MPTFLVIGMASPMRVVSRHDTAEDADTAKEAFGSPSNVVELEGDWPGFTGPDLVRIFNSLQPEVENRVARFETRAKGLERIKRALAPPGTISPETPVTPAQEKPVTTKKAKGRPTKQPDDDKVTLVTTAKAEKAKFNEGSARGKVFAAIGSKITLVELVRKCSHFANKAQVRGCVDKLKVMGYVKDEG